MFTFTVPTTTLFGADKLNELHEQINTPAGAAKGTKTLVVISNGRSTRDNGYLDCLENELKQTKVEYVIFDKNSQLIYTRYNIELIFHTIILIKGFRVCEIISVNYHFYGN